MVRIRPATVTVLCGTWSGVLQNEVVRRRNAALGVQVHFRGAVIERISRMADTRMGIKGIGGTEGVHLPESMEGPS